MERPWVQVNDSVHMDSFSLIVHVSVRLVCLQALLVIVVEKFFLKIPRVAGKIERFYINIVQGIMNHDQ
jgi:hypothetical protein